MVTAADSIDSAQIGEELARRLHDVILTERQLSLLLALWPSLRDMENQVKRPRAFDDVPATAFRFPKMAPR
jgi:hypothetical protein